MLASFPESKVQQTIGWTFFFAEWYTRLAKLRIMQSRDYGHRIIF